MAGVAGIILAAGMSTRMGEPNKLTEVWNGKPLVTYVAEAALASNLSKVAVVTGHEAADIEAVLPAGCDLTHNGDYANGMAGSLRAGIYRLQGVMPMMILLGDMPLIKTSHINQLIEVFEQVDDKHAIVAATCDGKWGNPVLFGPRWFVPLKLLEGDSGARQIMNENRERVVEVEIGEAARRDFDVPEAFEET